MIAAGLSPFSPAGVAIDAGKAMLGRVERLSRKGISFGLESTLSGRSWIRLIKKLKSDGYAIHLYFLWVRDLEIAYRRIKERVRNGGHDVPRDVVRRRAERGIRNLLLSYAPMCDSWILFDNSSREPKIIVSNECGDLRIRDEGIYLMIKESIGEF